MTKRRSSAVSGQNGILPIVALGASAGGLETLRRLFAALPADTGAAFVVITHLDPGRESHLAELLAGSTSMTVTPAAGGETPRAGTVHVLPPGANLSLADGVFALTDRRPGEHFAPIDHFLQSLAADRGHAAFAVILSGAGHDGALGVRAIKAADGIVLVQRPDTALHAGMPESAAAAGVADALLSVEEMAAFLTGRLAAMRGDLTLDRDVDPALLRELLALLKDGHGPDFAGYKPGTIKRRVHKRMLLSGATSLGDYINLVRTDPVERAVLAQTLLIGVTRFFRDPEAFALLGEQVIDPLLRAKGAGGQVRLWVADCSTGEEAYSLAMLAAGRRERLGGGPELKIFATDVDARSVETAKKGVYPAAIAADVPAELLARYFQHKGRQYAVKPELREMVVFAAHDVLRDPPFFRLDLIVCRNLLIYVGEVSQDRLLTIFYFALASGGHLMLGPSESIARMTGLFTQVDARWRIYKRLDAGAVPPLFSGFPARLGPESANPAATVSPGKGADPGGLVRRVLLDAYAPPAVLVDAGMDIVHVQGDVSAYLRLPQGEISRNVFKCAAGGVRFQLRQALGEAARTGRACTYRGQAGDGGANRPVQVTARPMDAYSDSQGLYLAVFEPVSGEPQPAINISESEALAAMDKELEAARGQLWDSIEAFDRMSHELGASNEELMSMNEELQSSYEELETTKEELQSINAELASLNAELEDRVALRTRDLEQAAKRLGLALDAAKAGVWEWSLADDVNFWSDDVWRLYDLDPRDGEASFARWSQSIHPQDRQATHEAVQAAAAGGLEISAEWRVNTRDGSPRWLMSRGQPQRGPDGRIESYLGVVMDITARKQAEIAQRENDARFKTFMDNSPAVGWLKDEQCRYVYVSRSFEEQVGIPASGMLGKGDFEVWPEDVATLLWDNDQAVLAGGGTIEVEETTLDTDGRKRFWRAFKFPMTDAHGSRFTGGVAVDITRRKQHEREIRDWAKFPQENPNPVLRVGKDLVITHANKASIPFLENFQTGTGQHFPKIYAGEVTRALSSGLSRQFRVEIDKRIFSFLVHPLPEDGYVNIYGLEETKRIRAEEALARNYKISRRQSEFLESLIAHAPVAIGVVEGQEHRFVLANPAYETAPEEHSRSMVGRTLAEVFPSVAGPVSELFEQVYATGKTVSLREYPVPIGEELTWWNADYIPLPGEAGRPSRILIIGSDVTQAVASRQAAEIEAARVKGVIDSLAEGLVITSASGKVVSVNPAAMTIYGFDACDQVPRQIGDFRDVIQLSDLDGRPLTDDEWPFARTLRGETFTGYELAVSRRDIDRKWISRYNGSAVCGRDGQVLFSILTFTDVTAVKQAEMELVRAKQAAEEASRAKSEFLANMSHELRTPLNGVLGMLQLLQLTEITAEQAEFIHTGIAAGKSLLRIISDILDLSRIEAGKFVLAREAFDPAALVKSVIAAFAEQVQAKNVILRHAVDPRLPASLIGDATRLRQILFNLVGNAIKFTVEGDIQVEMRLLRAMPELGKVKVLVTVADTGVGIPEDRLPVVFEPFTQADGSLTRQYQGCGLGLPIVSRMVDLMGGSCQLESEEGQGTTVAVEVVLETGAIEPPVALPVAEEPVSGQEGLTVLVVEDDPVNLFTIERFLQKLGHVPRTAADGRACLDILRNGEIDVVLMDILMPVMDGVEAARRIRAGEAGQEKRFVPIIALTAHAMKGDREHFLTRGMDDFLAKPLSMEDLDRSMRRVMERKAAGNR